MPITDAQRERLPKAVRYELERLESDVEYWKAKATAGPEDSNTFIQGGGLDRGSDTPLGNSPRIDFEPDGIYSRITARLTKDGWLELNGYENIIVSPRSGNLVWVKTDGRF